MIFYLFNSFAIFFVPPNKCTLLSNKQMIDYRYFLEKIILRIQKIIFDLIDIYSNQLKTFSLLSPSATTAITDHESSHRFIRSSNLFLTLTIGCWFVTESTLFLGIFINILFHLIIKTGLVLFGNRIISSLSYSLQLFTYEPCLLTFCYFISITFSIQHLFLSWDCINLIQLFNNRFYSRHHPAYS